MKRWGISLLAAVSMLVSGGIADRANALEVAMADVQAPSVLLDGYPLATSPKPINVDGTVMVPFRPIGEALGIEMEWVQATSTVVANDGKQELRMQIGNRTAWVGGKPVQLKQAPMLSKEGRTLIPLRFFSESVGAEVKWIQATQTAIIESQERDLHAMVFYGLGSYGQKGYLPYFDEASFTWSRLDQNGVLTIDQSEYAWPVQGAEELLTEVKGAGVDTSLMVFSVDEHGELTKLLRDVSLQEKFAYDLVELLERRGIGGAYLDFETLAPTGAGNIQEVRAQYAALVKRVADVLHSRGKKLTVVMAPLQNGWYRGYDYQEIAKHADHLFLMAYSYVDDRLPQPMNRIDEDIRAALQVVEPKKLILGINAYSETPAGVQEKIGLAKRYNLHGVGFWILRVFDDRLMEGIDKQLLLRPERNLR